MSEDAWPRINEHGISAPQTATTAAEGPVSHAIVRVARLHRMLASQLLRRIGLHPSQELVMMHLWDCGAQRQSDLTKLLGADAATITRTIQRLEQGGFVRRVQSATDRRVTIVEPTVASRALRTEVENAWRQLEQGVAGQLSTTEQVDALALLARMEASLQKVLNESRRTANPQATSEQR